MTEQLKSAVFAMIHLATDINGENDKMSKYTPILGDIVSVLLDTHSVSQDKIAEDTCTALADVMLKYPSLSDAEFLFCWDMAQHMAGEVYQQREAVGELVARIRGL